MTIEAVSQAVSLMNPQPISLKPPQNYGVVQGVIISNYTPFIAIIKGAGNTSVNQPSVQPYQAQIFNFQNFSGPIQVSFLLTTSSFQTGILPHITADWFDEASDVAGWTYPSALPIGPAAGNATDFLGTIVIPQGTFPSFSGTVTASKSYGSLQILASPAGTNSTPLACQFQDASLIAAAGLAPTYSGSFAPLPGQGNLNAGGQIELKCANEPGDSLTITAWNNGASSHPCTLSVFGSTSPPSSPVRPDGRNYPIGVFPFGITSYINATLIPAQGTALRLLIKNLYGTLAEGGGNVQASVAGTIDGTGVNLWALLGNTVTTGQNGSMPVGEAGQLLDPNTGLQLGCVPSSGTPALLIGGSYDITI